VLEVKKMIEEEILKPNAGTARTHAVNTESYASWRSLSGDYCFDGMTAEEAHREIKKTF